MILLLLPQNFQLRMTFLYLSKAPLFGIIKMNGCIALLSDDSEFGYFYLFFLLLVFRIPGLRFCLHRVQF